MKRCDPKARAKCPDGKQCELYAEFADGSECDKFNEKVLSQPMTNADRIRAMTDEELANYLAHYEHNIDVNVYTSIDQTTWLEWLRQPAEEV